MKKYLLVLLFIANQSFAQYTKLLDFTGANGSYPNGSLISDGTFLYGMAKEGGTNDSGAIFKIKFDGTGYSKLLDFAGANGKYPQGSLFSDGTFLYGMTKQGGTNDSGVIFKINFDGTGYSKLLDFTGAANGSCPNGSLVSDGTFLYGMTVFGGTNNEGTIFKIKLDGTGFSKLLDFAGTTNGKGPFGSLFYDGTFLYGTTFNGGTNNMGVVFKIKPDGTGFTKLLDFAGSSNGSLPYNSLTYDSAFLYGMTQFGGTNDRGVIFKIKPDGTGYLKLLDFAGSTNGERPAGSFFSDGTFLYGMTEFGGTNFMGVIFKINLDGTGYSKLLDFLGATNGGNPMGSFISDGTFLYGTTAYGGTSNKGTVFRYGLLGDSVEDISARKRITVSPNPSTGIFHFSAGSGEAISSVEVFTALGAQIFFKAGNATEVDLSKAAGGIYFYCVTTKGGRVFRGKFIKE